MKTIDLTTDCRKREPIELNSEMGYKTGIYTILTGKVDLGELIRPKDVDEAGVFIADYLGGYGHAYESLENRYLKTSDRGIKQNERDIAKIIQWKHEDLPVGCRDCKCLEQCYERSDSGEEYIFIAEWPINEN